MILLTTELEENANTDVCSVLVRPFPEFIDPEHQQTSDDQFRFTQHRNQPDKRLQGRTKSRQTPLNLS